MIWWRAAGQRGHIGLCSSPAHCWWSEGGVDALKAEVRKNMERELKQAVKNRIKEQAIDGLVKENEIDVPAALVDQEIQVLRQQAAQRPRMMQSILKKRY